MKFKFFAFALGLGALLFTSCNRECAVCTMYDKYDQPLGEYTSCASDPEQDAIENFCEGCEGPIKAVCDQVD
ncbi:MAG: hypothetical protein ACPGLV_15450 [Bacteroidia bacterium]